MKNSLYIFILSLLSTISVQAQQISYLWSTGDTTANFSANPSATTTYYVTVTQYGVSYVDSVTVVVNSVDTTYFTENACESFTWTQNGQTYTSTGIYTDTAVNNAGCDSILVLNLTINQSTSGSESITACDSFMWAANGQTYTTSGTYVDTLINAAGCDSVATLNLTINTTTFAYDTALSVGPYTWPVTGLVYDTSGTYYDTAANTTGCDSITTLTLTVVDSLQISAGASDTIVCKGETVTLSVTSQTPTGQYPPGTVHCNGIVTAVVDVTNPITGKTWMDRNLGASQVATSSTDTAAYGDLYQWGRGADGHQCRNSATTSTLSSTDTPGHGDFITVNSFPNDWRSPQNANLWQGVNGVNNPCPSGYRVPTDVELFQERMSWSSSNAVGGFNSPLKLVLTGVREFQTGAVSYVGVQGNYWSSSINSDQSFRLTFNQNGGANSSMSRSYGNAIRCIKN